MVRVTYCASDLTLSQMPAKCSSSLVLILEVVVTAIFQDGYSKAKSWKREWAGIVSLVTHWLAQQGVLLSVLRFNRIHFNRAFPRLHTYCDRAAAPCLFQTGCLKIKSVLPEHLASKNRTCPLRGGERLLHSASLPQSTVHQVPELLSFSWRSVLQCSGFLLERMVTYKPSHAFMWI